VQTLESAVAQAIAEIRASSGPAVLLLSPGFASWDQFTNYEQRGEAFTWGLNARLGDDILSLNRSKTVL
ncbi:MAG: hypothetical protein ACNA8P_00225, partial [Phycisphaerales bacterium]